MTIGFFDSGIGGLTVLNEALRVLPNYNYIYYADTDNVPYGVKSKEAVKSYVLEAADFIAGLGVKALVIACNTATSITIKDLRERFDFPVIGMEPAVKPAVEKNNHKRVLVAATPLTLKEEKFQNLIAKVDVDNIVDLLPLPGLVSYAEEFIFDEHIIIPYLNKELSILDKSLYGTVVLGCTHFPFFKRHFRQIFGTCTNIIDGNAGTVKRLKSILDERHETVNNSCGKIDFYSSGIKEKDTARFEKYLSMLDQRI